MSSRVLVLGIELYIDCCTGFLPEEALVIMILILKWKAWFLTIAASVLVAFAFLLALEWETSQKREVLLPGSAMVASSVDIAM